MKNDDDMEITGKVNIYSWKKKYLKKLKA